jgi:hypothetical protein
MEKLEKFNLEELVVVFGITSYSKQEWPKESILFVGIEIMLEGDGKKYEFGGEWRNVGIQKRTQKDIAVAPVEGRGTTEADKQKIKPENIQSIDVRLTHEPGDGDEPDPTTTAMFRAEGFLIFRDQQKKEYIVSTGYNEPARYLPEGSFYVVHKDKPFLHKRTLQID